MAREHSRTVVLVLPLEWTKQAAEAAPDLWTIRQPSVYLDTSQSSHILPAENSAPPDEPLPSKVLKGELPATVRRWLAAQKGEQAELSPWSAARAVEAALSAGDIELAWHIAQKTVGLIRGQMNDCGQTPERLRDLSVSMGKLGDVAHALGRLDEAQQAYRKSETLARALIKDFGPTPERLRDLSVSMEKLGDVARALGRLDEAQQAFETQVQIATELVESYGETGSALEVLANGEIRLGYTLVQQGKVDQASAHLSSARRLYQRLTLAFPLNERYKAELNTLETSVSDHPDNENNGYFPQKIQRGEK
jgi:tetratricopeptide (TPR) repeat protein